MDYERQQTCTSPVFWKQPFKKWFKRNDDRNRGRIHNHSDNKPKIRWPNNEDHEERLVFWPRNIRSTLKINRTSDQRDPNTIIDPPNTEKRKYSNKKVLQSNNNRNNTPKPHRTNINAGTRNDYRKFKENYVWNEDYITIAKKPNLENTQG